MNRSILSAAALATLALPVPALASGWTQQKGHGQVIVTGVYSNSTRGYDGDGNVVDIDDYEKTEAYLLVEYGLTDDLTVIANPSFRHVGIDGASDNTTGLGYTEVGARYRLFEGDGWVLSLQGTARIPGARRRDSLAQVGSTDAEYDLRALVGKGFRLGGMDAFVDVQGSYRLRDGDPPNEVHADATFGVRTSERMQILVQSFNTLSDGAGEGVFRSYRYHNAQVSAVYDVSDRVSIQLGGLATLGGQNALRERGIVTGLWFSF
jgi:protein XagA